MNKMKLAKIIFSIIVFFFSINNNSICQETSDRTPIIPESYKLPYCEYVQGDSVVYIGNNRITFPVSNRKVLEQILGKEIYININDDSLRKDSDRLVRFWMGYLHGNENKGVGLYYRKCKIVDYHMFFDKNEGEQYMKNSQQMKFFRHDELCYVDIDGDTLYGYFLMVEPEELDNFERLQKKKVSEFGNYEITLKKVEKPVGKNIGKSTLTNDGIYEDNIISIKWKEDRQIFNFSLKNMTSGMMKVVWDEALIVNFDGFTERVIHKGADLNALKQSQQPSLIPSKAQLADFFWSERYYGGNRLLDGYGGSKYKEENNGKRMSLILPVQVGNVSYIYTFIFEMNWKWSYPELREQ